MMNEKLKNLFLQAGGVVEVDVEGNYYTYTDELDPEFFAKLVIAECCDIADRSVEYGIPSQHINEQMRG